MDLATSPVALALQAQQTGRRRRLRRPPPWLHPRQLERQFAVMLQKLAEDFARNVRETIIPALPSIETEARLAQGRSDSERQDAWFDRLAPLMDILRISAAKRDATVSAQAIDIGQKTSAWNDKEWQKILRKTVGVGLLTAEPGLRDQLRLFAQTNANLITKMQADRIAGIRGVIERGFATGLRHTEVAKSVRAEADMTVNRARLIARDQVSKLNGRLTQMRQEEAGVSKYIWQSSDDARVRTSHEKMDGKLGRWDDASVYATVSEPDKWKPRSGINAVELHPGEDILCRCFAEPFMQELAEETEAAPEPKPKVEKEEAKKQGVEYAPLKTVPEAEEWAKGLGIKDVSYRTKNLAIANAVNETLAEYKAGGHPLPGLVAVDSRFFRRFPRKTRAQHIGFYSPENDILAINPVGAGNAASIAREQRKAGFWSTADRRHAYRHELGHAAHYKTDAKSFLLNRNDPTLLPSQKTKVEAEVSRYGATSKNELVAETLAGRMDGKTYSEDVMLLYRQYGGSQ